MTASREEYTGKGIQPTYEELKPLSTLGFIPSLAVSSLPMRN